MKPRNRAALGLGLALVTLILFAVLRRSCPMDPAPLREGDKHDSSELALSQDIPPRETTALVDGEEQAEPPLQVGQSGPEEEDRLKNAPGEPHDGPVADNSGSVDEATPEQIARLKDVLWWLPQDTETVGVAHGPFAFSFASKNQHVHNAASQFQRWVLPDIYVTDAERNGLDQVPVALVVKGSRCFRWESGGPLGVMVCGITTFEGCEIVVFKRPLDGAGDSSLAAVELRATKTELIEETTVAQVESDIGNQRLTSFIAHPAPEILIFANNRDYLAEVLARMAKKASSRAFDEALPEWKYFNLSARRWAMRHYKHAPESMWPFVGVLYSVEGGDDAKVLCPARSGSAHSRALHEAGFENALQFAKWLWGPSGEVREPEANLIEISVSVRDQQALQDFFLNLFFNLGG